jgi:protein-tyrosine phosphatase
MKVLFICLGNICRSPMAEGLFLSHIGKLSVSERFVVDSCGTGNWHEGELADKRMLKTASGKGIILTHKARQLRKEDPDTFDYLLVMDRQNQRDVLSLYPESADKIKLLTDFSHEHANMEIPDPYYGSSKDFEDVYELLNKVTLQLAHNLIKKHL